MSVCVFVGFLVDSFSSSSSLSLSSSLPTLSTRRSIISGRVLVVGIKKMFEKTVAALWRRLIKLPKVETVDGKFVSLFSNLLTF